MKATATRLIAKHGRAMTLRAIESYGAEYNPTLVDVDEHIMGVMLEYEAHERDSMIQSSDKKVLTTAQATAQMKLVDGGVEYEIISVKPLQPGDTVIMSELQVRR